MNARAQRLGIGELCRIAFMAAVIAVCSWITVPLTAVPFTLQTFGVFMAVRLLGGKSGTVSIMLYILLGLVGVPVFAGFGAGPSALLGPTGGYIIGFLCVGGLYWALEKKLTKTVFKDLALGAGLILCYLMGTLWFMYSLRVDAAYALGVCVLPFMLPDLLKLILSRLTAAQLERALRLKHG